MISPHEPARRSSVATLHILVRSLREPRFRFLVGATGTLVVAAAVAMRILDHKDFGTLGRALWWSVQTVTTVGYGDVVPEQPIGRIIATLLMVVAISFIAILTSIIASSFVVDDPEARRRANEVRATLARIEQRLDHIEQSLAGSDAERPG